jgi:probable rRNA maturation factor
MLIISKTIKRVPRGIPYASLKKETLGPKYNLSLVFIGDKRAQALNKRYRDKDKPANVLAFSLEKTAGEILINPKAAERDTKIFGLTKTKMIALLFIHGMLHLKGMRHGRKMEEAERLVLKQSMG